MFKVELYGRVRRAVLVEGGSQRVSHTTIVENKRLSHALATVKAQQDKKHEPKVQTNSEKIGYKKNPRDGLTP